MYIVYLFIKLISVHSRKKKNSNEVEKVISSVTKGFILCLVMIKKNT